MIVIEDFKAPDFVNGTFWIQLSISDGNTTVAYQIKVIIFDE